MKNYRPVSDLNFVSSKIRENVIANRIRSHLERNDLSNQYQSAYKKFHSTETVLLKVENDIFLNMDEGRVTALTLLDLSAAFDTLDHISITNLLSTWYGIDGIALDWFVSYLSDRTQKVKLMGLFIQSSRCRVLGFPKDPSSAHCYLLSTLPPLAM